MKRISQLFRPLPLFLLLCHAIAITSEYEQHYACLTFSPQQHTYPPNISLNAQATPHVNTNNHHNNAYPTPEQLAIVMNWLKQLYPDNTQTIAQSQQKISL